MRTRSPARHASPWRTCIPSTGPSSSAAPSPVLCREAETARASAGAGCSSTRSRWAVHQNQPRFSNIGGTTGAWLGDSLRTKSASCKSRRAAEAACNGRAQLVGMIGRDQLAGRSQYLNGLIARGSQWAKEAAQISPSAFAEVVCCELLSRTCEAGHGAVLFGSRARNTCTIGVISVFPERNAWDKGLMRP